MPVVRHPTGRVPGVEDLPGVADDPIVGKLGVLRGDDHAVTGAQHLLGQRLAAQQTLAAPAVAAWPFRASRMRVAAW